ncbi:hypothetical protein LB505_008957 [Fusarium chuoi]|nr:hypothetical protein LB505_008957 [Fusarium chuoi]
MNSLGAGGAASPKLINAANALTFCLMVVSCYFSSTMVRYIGIKGALIFGTWSVHQQPLRNRVARPRRCCSLWYLCWCLLDGRSCYRHCIS